MDLPSTKEDCKQTFRRANKILNLWIEQKLPFTNVHLLQEKYQEYELIRKKDELAAAEFLVEEPNATSDQIEFSVDLTNALNQIRLEAKPRPARFKKKSNIESMTGQEYLEMRLKAIRENTNLTPEEKQVEAQALSDQVIKWISVPESKKNLHAAKVDKVIVGGDAFTPYDMFNLYLYSNDKHDNDIEIDIQNLKLEQKKVLKQIKNIIKNLNTYNINELANLDKLFLKIISLLNYSQFEFNQEFDFEVLENWAKIGLWLIEKSCQTANLKSWELAAIKPMKQYAQKVMAPLVALIYSQLAYFLSMSNKPEKIFSENLLEIAHSLQEKFLVTVQTHQTIQLVNTICLCTQAKIFLDNNQITQFTTTVNQVMQTNHRYNTSIFKILYLAGKYFCEHNPDNAKLYFEEALKLLNEANMREKSLEQNYEKEIQSFLVEYKTKKLAELQGEIIKTFPFCGVGISSEKLNVFLYLDEVPHGEVKLPLNSPIIGLKKYNKVQHKDKILTGFRFYIPPIKTQMVIRSIHKLIHNIEQTLNFEQEKLERKMVQLTLESKPLFCTSTPKPIKVVTSSPPQQHSRAEPKKKTRATPPKNKTTQVPLLTRLPIIKKMASAYGFKLGGDNLIAPIYFSKAHKERGNPQIVACWDEHKCLNLDSEVIRKFKGLFDPAGVVQARKVNEQGFKILVAPNNQWIVRGKLEGVGDSTRVYFKPVETIVADGGETITLYKLKKKINK